MARVKLKSESPVASVLSCASTRVERFIDQVRHAKVIVPLSGVPISCDGEGHCTQCDPGGNCTDGR